MLGVCGGLVGVGRATEYTLHVETQSQLHTLSVFSGLYVVFMISIKDMRIRVDCNIYIYKSDSPPPPPPPPLETKVAQNCAKRILV